MSGILDDRDPFSLAEDPDSDFIRPAPYGDRAAGSEQFGANDGAWSESSSNAEKLSILGPTVRFKGELVADENLMIQGHIEGSIEHKASRLTIGPKGSVKADIHGNHIVVQGEVRGDLYATDAVILESTARLNGNIFSPRIALKDGAKFKGSIDMDAPGQTQNMRAPTQSEPSRNQSTSTQNSNGKKRNRHRNKHGGNDRNETAPESKVNEILD